MKEKKSTEKKDLWKDEMNTTTTPFKYVKRVSRSDPIPHTKNLVKYLTFLFLLSDHFRWNILMICVPYRKTLKKEIINQTLLCIVIHFGALQISCTFRMLFCLSFLFFCFSLPIFSLCRPLLPSLTLFMRPQSLSSQLLSAQSTLIRMATLRAIHFIFIR